MIQAAGTHPGMTGKINEDRYGITTCQVSSSNTTRVTFAVVCDGIGGHRSGEIAAELAVNIITNTVINSFGDRPLKTMLLAAQLANEAIYTQAQTDENKRGMGATCAMVWVEGSRLFTTSIGDTRIYLIRRHLIKQLTTDHTWVQEALEKGTITKDQAVGHPNAHVIRRYLGAPVVPQADQRLQLQARGGRLSGSGKPGYQPAPGRYRPDLYGWIIRLPQSERDRAFHPQTTGQAG